MGSGQPVLVVENDVWARLIGVVLDPTTSPERFAAFADFMSPDLPDFRGWCERVRKRATSLYPSEVRLVSSREDLHDNLGPAQAIVTESLRIGAEELDRAPRLKVVHKYGALFRNIDVAACEARGVKVLGVRRRANIACAEHAFASTSLPPLVVPMSPLIGATPRAPIGVASQGCGPCTATRSGSSVSARLAARSRAVPTHLE